MGSGPGRALIRAEDLYDDLDWDEHANAAVLCLETRDPPSAQVAEFVAERAGVLCSALTLLMAPTASVAGGVQIAARVVETALHKLHELDFDVRRVVAGFGSCPLPPVAGDAWRRSGAPTTPCSTAARSTSPWRPTTTTRCATSCSGFPPPRRRTTASRSARSSSAKYDFYKVDPLLFSPAQISLTSVGSGRSFEAGGVDPEVLERSFWR